MKVFEKLFRWLTSLPIPDFLKGMLALPLLVVIVPIIIIQIIIGIVNNRAFNKAYRHYLQSIEGAKFFCYNNRKTSIDFIEQEIIPRLSPEIKVIFINGRKLQTEYNQYYLSHALYQIKMTAGFPYLLKVVNEEIVDISLNKELFDVLNKQNRDQHIDRFLKTISSFFDS